MKIKSLKSCMLAFMAATMVVGFTACHSDDDEVQNEIIEDPAETVVEYYIGGKVADQEGEALAGVSVKLEDQTVSTDAEGLFEFTVSEKKTYKLEFVLDGYEYMGAGEVSVAADAENRTLVVFNASLSKKGVTVDVSEEVKAAEEKQQTVVITEKGAEVKEKDEVGEDGTPKEESKDETAVAVNVAPGAIEPEDAKGISVNPYIPENENKAKDDEDIPETDPEKPDPEQPAPEKKVEAAVVNVKIDSEKDIILKEPVAIQVQAKVEKKENAFKTVKVYREEEVRATNWTYVCDAEFNTNNNSYVMKLEKGQKLNGNFSFRVEPVLKSTKKLSKVIKQDEISNIGNVNAIDYTISYDAPMGWSASILGSVDAAALKQIKKVISSRENGAEGTYQKSFTQKGKLSGNHVLYYSVVSNFTDKTYSVELQGSHVDIDVISYNGTEVKRETKFFDQHSGGGIN